MVKLSCFNTVNSKIKPIGLPQVQTTKSYMFIMISFNMSIISKDSYSTFRCK